MTETGHDLDAPEVPAMTGARVFVTLVFALLGVSFVASTALLIHEFSDLDWPALLLLHSHLFVFFPTLGLVALAAFHLPATVFTHLYWTRIARGRVRFLVGAIFVVLLTAFFSASLLSDTAVEVWEIAPRALMADSAEPANCGAGRTPCQRVSVLDGIGGLREAAQSRIGLSKFARVCRPDPLLETPDDFVRERFCFATRGKLSGADCCRAQALYSKQLNAAGSQIENKSLSAQFDRIALPLKTFFVIVLVVIGVLLVIWRKTLETHYHGIAPAIERSLLIGAVAMLPWPFMDYAYLEAMQTLTGRWSSGPQFRLSLVIAPWALLLLLYFLARMGRKIERMGQLAGAVASVIALLRYEQLNDWAVRVLGAGAPMGMIGALVAFAIVCLLLLRQSGHLQRAINVALGAHPNDGAAQGPGTPPR